jgi:(p)ppGpp synthase/HD superfamily hydrolase
MKVWSQDVYTKAWNFASYAHKDQNMPGSDLPYITHIGNVAMEVMSAIVQSNGVNDPDLSVQCALLHDVIEDTHITYEQVNTEFGQKVADGVLALQIEAYKAFITGK